MSNETKLIALLKANLSTTVYSDLVPESVTEGVAISNVANPFGRILNGDKTQRSGVWRVTIVASSKARRDAIITELENLDNTSDNDFQRIYADLVNKEAKESEEQPVVRAFVDITLYPR
jgi:hypothetical protein